MDTCMRPSELVPAAHFDKALDQGICHGFWIPLMYVLLSPTYSENSATRVCFLVIEHGNKVIVPPGYCVTEGCVT